MVLEARPTLPRTMTVEEETETVDMLNAAINFSEGISLVADHQGHVTVEVHTTGGHKYVATGDCLYTALRAYNVQRNNRALYGE